MIQKVLRLLPPGGRLGGGQHPTALEQFKIDGKSIIDLIDELEDVEPM